MEMVDFKEIIKIKDGVVEEIEIEGVNAVLVEHQKDLEEITPSRHDHHLKTLTKALLTSPLSFNICN